MLPVSTFLWVRSVAGLLSAGAEPSCPCQGSFPSATPSPAWVRAGIFRKQSHLSSTRNPFISEPCEDPVFREKKKEKGKELGGSGLFDRFRASFILELLFT